MFCAGRASPGTRGALGKLLCFPWEPCPKANGHGGSARPSSAVLSSSSQSSNSGGEQGGGESTTRALGHLHWNGDTAGMGGREGTGGDGAAVGVPGACCALRSR